MAGSVSDHEDQGNDGNVRKRVGKACDRCRLKKSKCDGSKPCSRCKADNQLCLFGERKKSHDKVYPKGYVELLEHQQGLLVHGLQSLYKQYWTGPSLPEVEGAPLVHDMLASLGLLHDESLGSPASMDGFTFEESTTKMQASLEQRQHHSESGQGSCSTSTASLSPASSPVGLMREALSPPCPPTPREQDSFSTQQYSQPTLYQNSQFSDQMYMMSPNNDSMKQVDMSFVPSSPGFMSATEYEALNALQAPFPVMTPNFGDINNDFMEDDSFGNFIDLDTQDPLRIR